MKKREVAREMDARGITVVNYRDPVDGSPIAGITAAEAGVLLEEIRLLKDS